jgi:Type II secretion system (T2SS), protein E, N-terminal domain
MKHLNKNSERERVGGPVFGSHWHRPEGEQDQGEQDQGELASPGEPGTKRAALGSLLIQSGIATKSQVKEAVNEGLQTGERLGEVAVRRGWATQEQIAVLLADQWQLRYLGTEALSVDLTALRLLPIAAVHELDAVPIGFDERGVLVAVAEPSLDLFAAVRERIGQEVSFAVVTRAALDLLLRSRMLGDAPAAVDESHSLEPLTGPDEPEPVEPKLDAPDAVELSAFATPEAELAVPTADGEHPEALDEVRETREKEREAKPLLAIAAAIAEEPAVGPRPGFELPAGTSSTRPPAVALATALEESRTELQRLHERLPALVDLLAQVQEELGQLRKERDAADAAQKKDAETITKLEAELSRRDDLFEGLKDQVARLTVTLGAARPD